MTSITELLEASLTAQITVSAILGGIAFKVIEHFLNAKNFVNEHTQLRAELRQELDIVRNEVSELRHEVDNWREKYYTQVHIANQFEFELSRLRVELREYKEKVDTFSLISTDETLIMRDNGSV